MSTAPAIRTEKLRKVYRSGFFRSKFVGLDGLDLEVQRGECFGYIGPNGAGKTTTIKLLLGLNFPTSGRAELLGEPVGSLKARARVGYLPERPYFYDYLTAEEFLHFYGSLHGLSSATRKRRIDELLPLVHMDHARKTPLRKFSKGMLQRVGIAQALINEPELVVLDEPSSGLDPMGRMLIRDTILGLKAKGVTILLSSHILSDVEEVCDRVALIKDGKMERLARVDELVGQGILSVEVTLSGISAEQSRRLGAGTPIGIHHGRVVFSVPSSEDATRLVTAASQAGATVVQVRPRKRTLEQLFLDEMSQVTRADEEKTRL